MPWDIRRDEGRCSEGKPWAVVQRDNDRLMGCHETRERAAMQIAALQVAEQERQGRT